MTKSIIKEICIMLLLCACIVLLFGIMFYDYIPLSKVVPNKVAYEVPEEIKQDLETNVETEEIKTQIITYSVDSKDLLQFKNSGRLEEGKLNPFALYTESTSNNTITSGNTISNTNSNSGGTYYPNTGTK